MMLQHSLLWVQRAIRYMFIAYIMHMPPTYASGLDHLIGQQRVILLFDQPQHPASAQMEAWGAVDLAEWKIHLMPIPLTDQQTRQAWHINKDTRLILIGLDGEEKLRLNRLATFEEITDLIAQMPMRQYEQRLKRKP